MPYDFSDPNFDFAGQEDIVLRALKEGIAQQATPFNKGVNTGQAYAMSGADPGAFLSRAAGMLNQRNAEGKMGELNKAQQLKFASLLRELGTPGTVAKEQLVQGQGPLLQPPTETVQTPMSPLEDSRRRMDVYGRMSMLPMAAKMAQKGMESEMDMPERMALRDQQIAAAKDAQDRAIADKRETREWQAGQNEIYKRTAAQQTAQLAVALAAKGGSGPRDRYSVQTGPDNQMYRVNLETGQATPISIGSALPNAIGAAQPGAGLTKPKPPMSTKAQDVQRGLQNLESGISAYQQLLQSYDPASKDALTDEKRASIGSAFTDLQMRMKEAYELGAITGPDMQVLQSAITDPTSAWGMARGAVGGRKPFEAQIKQQQAALGRSKKNFEQQYGVVLPPPAGNVIDEAAAKEARYQEYLRSRGK